MHRLTLEMTITREDFLRLLPAAVGGTLSHEAGDHFRGGDVAKRWAIQLIPLAEHRLGRLVLPSHRIELQFDGFAQADVDAFMARFLQKFQRGGG